MRDTPSIKSVRITHLTRNIMGEISGLQGEVELMFGSVFELKIPLSPETLNTLQECIERDTNRALSEMIR